VEETHVQIKGFEDIIAWQKAKEVVTQIYQLSSGLRDYSFKDQLCRAAVSIMNNIAEGYERGTNQELKHFLYISKGSTAEVRSMIYLGENLKYFSVSNGQKIIESTTEISKILSGFIKTL
jgi:four helix bundle protein